MTGVTRQTGMNTRLINTGLSNTGLIISAAIVSLAVASCGGGETLNTQPSDGPQDTSPQAEAGTITVNIEEVQGIFTEGFEIGLRFETPEGTVIDSVLWSDYITSLDNGDFYKSTLVQSVPAGTVNIIGEANIGIGPPPETPDIDGEMRCRLTVDVPSNGNVAIEVTFSDPDICLLLK